MSSDDVKKVIALLGEKYPDASPELLFNTPLELLIAAILSAQCTDVRVNMVTRELFARCKCARDFIDMGYEELEAAIRSVGFYRVKARHIIDSCVILENKYGGEPPRTLEELTRLPGVGRKVANVVLSNAYSVPAIAVDTHVFRVANRIGLATAKDVLKTEKQLMACIPKQDWSIMHHRLIFHGRRCCKAIKPRCAECALSFCCRYYAAEKE